MSVTEDSLDQDSVEEISAFQDGYLDDLESDTTDHIKKTDGTARARLEALRERRALRNAIYDDLYSGEFEDD